jgi:phage baseplate assembly protein W
MAERQVYVGFSTVGRDTPPFRLFDIELVKQDLMNVFYTRQGERAMRPEYGSNIFDYLMEPFDEETVDAIIEDAIRIINSEPRVELVAIEARDLDYVIRLEIQLNFKPQDVIENLYIDYDRRNLAEI